MTIKLFLDDANLPTYQLRTLPLGGSNLLLGFIAYKREMQHRKMLNMRLKLSGDALWDIPEWEELKIYSDEENPEPLPPFVIEDHFIPVIVEAIERGGSSTVGAQALYKKALIKELEHRKIATYKVRMNSAWDYTIII